MICIFSELLIVSKWIKFYMHRPGIQILIYWRTMETVPVTKEISPCELCEYDVKTLTRDRIEYFPSNHVDFQAMQSVNQPQAFKLRDITFPISSIS